MRFQPPFNLDPDHSDSDPEPEYNWEQFALLSAYLDEQVSAAEIEQVKQLLAEDRQFERLYREQCQIRQMLVQMPVRSSIPAETLIAKVNTQLNHRQKRRNLSVVALGAIATLCAVSLSLFDFSGRQWNTADLNSPTIDDESLVLAMEYPIVPPSAMPSLD